MRLVDPLSLVWAGTAAGGGAGAAAADGPHRAGRGGAASKRRDSRGQGDRRRPAPAVTPHERFSPDALGCVPPIQLIFSLVKLRLFRADRSAITYPLAHLSKTRHRLCLCLCQRDSCGHGGVSGAEQRREPGSVDTNERLVAGYGRGEGPERRTEAGTGTRPHRNHFHKPISAGQHSPAFRLNF